MYELSMIVIGVMGQAGSAVPTDAAAAVKIESVWDFVVKGGPVMIPIGLCSLIALSVVIERLFSLKKSTIIPPGFVTGLRAMLDRRGADRSAALAYCQASGSPLANIVAVGLKRQHAPLENLEKAVAEAGAREVTALRKYLRVLSFVIAVSPLLGLLGTILGMISAFQTVAASGENLGRTELLAKGIYEAMITTAAGLIVTIPALACYHWLCAKIDRLVQDMDLIATELFEELQSGHESATNLAAGVVSATRVSGTTESESPSPLLATAAA